MVMLFSNYRQFLDNLRDRLQEWSPVHCVGEIFIKFGSQLDIYTNFFNNYPVVLKTIEKVNDAVTIQTCIRTLEVERKFCVPSKGLELIRKTSSLLLASRSPPLVYCGLFEDGDPDLLSFVSLGASSVLDIAGPREGLLD